MSQAVLQYRNSKLFWNGLDLNQKLISMETPAYVYSRQLLQNRFQVFQKTFPKARLHFAMKSNHWAPFLKELQSLGAHVDVVSSGEIAKALECGFKPDQILFSGVGKTKKEIAYALEKQIFQINVESQDELDKIISLVRESRPERDSLLAERAEKPVRIGLRWTPGLDVKTHKFIKTSHDDTKFGLSQEDIQAMIPKIQKHKFIQFQGISVHLGSQIMDLEDFRQAFIDLKEFLESLPLTSMNVDLGGGLGINYHSADLSEDEQRLIGYQKVFQDVWGDSKLQVLFEPGRFISARTGGLITQVQAIKKTKTKTIVVVDAGMNNLIRPVLYEAYHEIYPLILREGPKQKVDVVGPICESSDFLALDRELPPLQVGDYVFIADAGAYGSSMSSDYNLRTPATQSFLD